MGKLITAIIGAGFFSSIIAMRKYFGIILVMLASTMIFKADIVDYIKQSSKQSHEERMIQMNVEAEKFKIETEAKQLREAKEKAEIEFYQKETKRLEQEQEKKDKEKKLAEEKKFKAETEYEEKLRVDKVLLENKRIEEQQLWRSAKTKMCSEFQRQNVNMLRCAVDSSNPQFCAQGHATSVWYNGAAQERVKAINSGCDVSLTNWQ